MKNLLVSALVIGALAAPVAYAADESVASTPAQEESVTHAKEKKKSAKHHKKHKHAKHKKHATHHRSHGHDGHKHRHYREDGSDCREYRYTESGRTPAERQIDQETEKTRR
jgi:Ni/Co efflux regulator RcnB